MDCLWEAYLGIVFACILSLYELFNYPQKEAFKFVNYTLSISFMIIVSFIPIFIIYLLYLNQENIHKENFKNKWEVFYERLDIEENKEDSEV